MTQQEDYEGLFKWKLVVPGFYILSWAALILGLMYFPKQYQILCFFFLVYSSYKTMELAYGTFVGYFKLKQSLKYCEEKSKEINLKEQENITVGENQQTHIFIIPSYKQDEELLIETLQILAQHPSARSKYVVFMAMEAHEEGSSLKAQALISKLKNKFLYMNYTSHQLKEHEGRIKASNVTWCLERLEKNLKGIIHPNQSIVTIIDADSWVPKQYIMMLEKDLTERPERKFSTIYSSPHIYTRNNLNVPLMNRVYDNVFSDFHMSSMSSKFFIPPYSNFSASYCLLKEIGFLDTLPEAIADDIHTAIKCFYKREKQTFFTPIYIPNNQLSPETGKGYFREIKEKFTQLQRHARGGVLETAYTLNMLFKNPITFKRVKIAYFMLECVVLPTATLCSMVGMVVMYKIWGDQQLQIVPMWAVDMLINGAPAITLVSVAVYELFKRKCNTEIYGRTNESVFRFIEYPTTQVAVVFGYNLVTYIIASFKVLFTAGEFTVSQKTKSALNSEEPKTVLLEINAKKNQLTPKQKSKQKIKKMKSIKQMIWPSLDSVMGEEINSQTSRLITA